MLNATHIEATTATEATTAAPIAIPAIDCALHNVVPETAVLFPYLPVQWREHIEGTLFKGAVDAAYPRNAPTSSRPGSTPPGGGPPGSDLVTLREHTLDAPGVECGILTCTYAIDSLRNPDAAIALARAVNDWQIAEWLDQEPRLRASIVVPSQLPEAAAREIERVGAHPGFVQVALPARSHHPYGNRLYHPLWEAMTQYDLVGGISFGGAPGVPPTPSGWPSTYFEEYAGMAQVFQSQLVSIISEGVFDQFPALRVTLMQSGWTWLPAFMWRFDKEWRNLRRLVPWVRRAPSAYVREHVRFTVQPLDAPPDAAHLRDILEELGSDDLLLYGSDYPHQHRATPEDILLPHFSEASARKIWAENARTFYRL